MFGLPPMPEQRSGDDVASMHGMPPPSPAGVPWQQVLVKLPGLGPVLCLYPTGDTLARSCCPAVFMVADGALSRLSEARQVRCGVWLAAPFELDVVSFVDGDGVLCLALGQLPDTDVLAWDELVAACALARHDGYRCPKRDGCRYALGLRQFEWRRSGHSGMLATRALCAVSMPGARASRRFIAMARACMDDSLRMALSRE